MLELLCGQRRYGGGEHPLLGIPLARRAHVFMADHADQRARVAHADIEHRADAQRRHVVGQQLLGAIVGTHVFGGQRQGGVQRLEIARCLLGGEHQPLVVRLAPRAMELLAGDRAAIGIQSPEAHPIDPKRLGGNAQQARDGGALVQFILPAEIQKRIPEPCPAR